MKHLTMKYCDLNILADINMVAAIVGFTCMRLLSFFEPPGQDSAGILQA